jgi:ankyrin repeat protein
MRKVSKTSFFGAARMWRAHEVAAAVRERPELALLRDASGRTALHICARQPVSDARQAAAAVATVRVLLAAGTDINAVQPIPDSGETFPATALWHALAWGRNRRLGAYLLEHGAEPNNCMFAMVWADDLGSAKLLRRHGARVDEVFHGETPLIYAMRHRRARFGEWLLSEGADPSFRDRRGFTALHHAVRRQLPASTLRALVRHGADVGAVSRDGVLVAQLATRTQRQVLGIDRTVPGRSPGQANRRLQPSAAARS